MMHVAPTSMLGRAFSESAAPSDYKAMLRRHEREQRDRLDRKAQVRENDADDDRDLAMAAIVSAMEIDAFRVELTRYDIATVTALQKNELELLRVHDQLNPYLARAFVLEDGRRVFKTEDGMRVFDEDGQQVQLSVIAPDEIGDERPRWEEVEDMVARRKALEAERAELIDYQQKLDAARERLDAGDITRGEFEAMQDELASAMPAAVRDQFPDAQAPSHNASEELDIGLDDIPALTTPKIPGAFAPG